MMTFGAEAVILVWNVRPQSTMARHTFPLLLLVASVAVGALACSDTRTPTGQPVPPPPPTSFAIRPALDTALIGEYVEFVAQRADSTVDLWTVSDSSVARLVPMERGRALLVARRPGTVTIKATRQGDSGQATLIIPPFAITPILDTVTVGELVTYEANQWPYDSIHWSFSDSSLVYSRGSVNYSAGVAARAVGTVIITASHHGDTARATLVIRQPQPGEWETIDLGLLDNHVSMARAINDDGTIVGVLEESGTGGVGFIYKDGAMRKLPGVGTHYVSAQAIGPSGTIAGIVYDGATNQNVVVVWDNPDAAPRLLLGQEYEFPDIVGVNARGDVLVSVKRWVGEYPYQNRAVLWRDGVRLDLGDLQDSTAYPWTEAQAWNTIGQIVGRSQVRNRSVIGTEYGDVPGLFHPYLWENGVMHDLGTLAPLPCPAPAMATDCSWGEAVDINSQGVVVGNANGADGKTRAFIWENGVMRDLGVSPGHNTAALAINDRGQVLGTIDAYTMFLWDNGAAQVIGAGTSLYAWMLGPNGEVIGNAVWQDGRLTDLGESYPIAVNSRGEIVGFSGYNRYTRATLWRKKP